MRIIIMLLACVIFVGSVMATVKQSTPTIKKQPLDPHKLSQNDNSTLKPKKPNIQIDDPAEDQKTSPDPSTPATLAS